MAPKQALPGCSSPRFSPDASAQPFLENNPGISVRGNHGLQEFRRSHSTLQVVQVASSPEVMDTARYEFGFSEPQVAIMIGDNDQILKC